MTFHEEETLHTYALAFIASTLVSYPLSALSCFVLARNGLVNFPLAFYYQGGVTLVIIPSIIGLHWDLDPTRFPRSFCIWQAICVNVGPVFINIGFVFYVWGLFRAVVYRSMEQDILRIRPSMVPLFVAPVIIIPMLFVVFALKEDALGPAWGACDVVEPVWVRVFGYAFVSIVCAMGTVPCVVAIIVSIFWRPAVKQNIDLGAEAGTLTVMEAETWDRSARSGHGLTLGRQFNAETLQSLDNSLPNQPPQIVLPIPAVAAALSTKPWSPSSLSSAVPDVRAASSRKSLEKGMLVRMLLLLALAFSIHVLAGISTVVALCRGKPLHGVQTHHVAAILVPWGPVLVHGSSALVRQWVIEKFRRLKSLVSATMMT